MLKKISVFIVLILFLGTAVFAATAKKPARSTAFSEMDTLDENTDTDVGFQSGQISTTEANEYNRITISFKNIDVKAAMKIFSKASGFSVIVDKEARGKVSGSVKNTPVFKALDSLLDDTPFTWTKKGDIIIVRGSPPGVRSLALKYITSDDIKDILGSLGATIVASKNLNAITIKAEDTSKIDSIIAAVKNLDKKPLQVLLRFSLVSLKNLDVSKAGFDFKIKTANNANRYAELYGGVDRPTETTATNADGTTTTITTPPTGFYSQVLAANAEAYLSSISTLTDYNILASPQITAINHKEATIHIGSKLGYKIITRDITTGGTTTTSEQIQYLETGIKITFVPHIGDDGFMILDIKPEISEGTVTDNVPSEDTTMTTNQIMVKDGQSFVIGGLKKENMSQVDSGIPFLMSLPFVGNLFKRTSVNKDVRDILIFVNADIITPDQMGEMADICKKMQEKQSKINRPQLVR